MALNIEEKEKDRFYFDVKDAIIKINLSMLILLIFIVTSTINFFIAFILVMFLGGLVINLFGKNSYKIITELLRKIKEDN